MSFIGKEIKGIRLLSRVGSGGMGTVYRGRVLKQKRGLEAGDTVAVKVLHSHLTGDPSAVKRFKREAGLGLTLRHRNIIRTFYVSSDRIEGARVIYLVQEYVRGGTLESLLKESGPLSDPFLRKIGSQIAGALRLIHGRQITHRDLKPANVFLDRAGNVKLADFGLSHVEKGVKKEGSSSGFLGTVAYAAPERFGPYRVDQGSDLYSLGVILYELAVGSNPFLVNGDLAATICRHMDLMPVDPSCANSSVSPFMSMLIMELLTKSPRRRLGPSSRVAAILHEEEKTSWWKRIRPDSFSGSVSPRRRKLSVMRLTPAYGREMETSLLVKLMDEVLNENRARAVCLLGEAGSGKTRIADLFLEEMDLSDKQGRVLVVDCAQGSGKAPYFPLFSSMKSALDLDGIEGRELERSVEKKLGPLFPGRERLVERFARFMAGAAPEAGETEWSMHPGQTALFFSECFAAIVEEKPLVIVVENMNEADPLTFKVIAEMPGHIRNARVFLVITARTGEYGDWERTDGGLVRMDALRAELKRSGMGASIEVKRLGRASVGMLLSDLGFTADAAEGPFGDRLFSVTEGNPDFVLKIARGVLSEEADKMSGDTGTILPSGIPSSIREIFYRRLIRLSSLERKFLDFASVIGIRFRVDDVVEGLGLDFAEAARITSRLQIRYNMIHQAGKVFRFDHILLRDLLYGSLDPEEKAGYHRKIGSLHEARAVSRTLSGREYCSAAMHFSLGKDHAGALTFFQEAFDYLRYKHFHDRAFRLSIRAASHLGALKDEGRESDSSFECDIFLKQAEVAGFLGLRKVQFGALKKGLNAARRSNSNQMMALVRLRIGQYYLATSRFISALNFIESTLSWMQRLNDLRGEADALQTLSRILLEIGADERVLGHLRKALEIRKRLNDKAGEAAVLVDMGTFYLGQAKPVAAREAFTKARRLYKSKDVEDEAGLASVLQGLSRIALEQGDPYGAEKLLVEAEKIACDVGDAALEADIQEALGICFLKLYDIQKAMPFISKGLRLSVLIEDMARQARFLSIKARMYAHPANLAPDFNKALSCARKAVLLSRNASLGVRERVSALNVLAAVFYTKKRYVSAYAIYRKAYRLLGKAGITPELAEETVHGFKTLAKKLGRKTRFIIRR